MGSDYHSRSAINPADNTCDPTTSKVKVTCSHTRVDLCLHPHTLEPFCFCPKLPCRSFQEMTVNPWLPTNCHADCPHHHQGNDDAPVMKIPSRITLVPEDDQTVWDSPWIVHSTGAPGITLMVTFAMLAMLSKVDFYQYSFSIFKIMSRGWRHSCFSHGQQN